MKKLKYNKANQRLIEQGLKTHTCRPLKPQPELPKGVNKNRPVKFSAWEKGITAFNKNEFGMYIEGWPNLGKWGLHTVHKCPYGAEGDRIPLYTSGVYEEDEDGCKIEIEPPVLFTHATIESEKPERIQEITKEEFEKEGITGEITATFCTDLSPTSKPIDHYYNGDGLDYSTPKDAFQAIWDDIYGPDAWERNDYCWFIKFKPEVKDEKN